MKEVGHEVEFSSKRVPNVLATERDSNLATCFAVSTYGFRKREYCYEEGSFRGARLLSMERNDTPVNARGRKIGRWAYCVFGPFLRGFATIRPYSKKSLFRKKK